MKLFLQAALFFMVSLPANGQETYNRKKIIENLAPTIKQLQVLANSPAFTPAELNSARFPGARFVGIDSIYKLLNGKRMVVYTWTTNLSNPTLNFMEIELSVAAHKELDRAFKRTPKDFAGAYHLDPGFNVQLKYNGGNTPTVFLKVNIVKEDRQKPEDVAASVRQKFYQNLSAAQGSKEKIAAAASQFYIDLKSALLPSQVMNDAYFLATKETAATNSFLAFELLRIDPQIISPNSVYNALSPKTADSTREVISGIWQKRRDEQTVKAQKAAAENAAAAAAYKRAYPSPKAVVPGKLYTIKTMVIFTSLALKNHLETDDGTRIYGEPVSLKELRPGDHVFVEKTLRTVKQVNDSLILFSDNTTHQRYDYPITTIRGVWLQRDQRKIDCRECSNRGVMTNEVAVNAVTGYKTHTYNTSGRTYNVISTPTTTQVGSYKKTTTCTACNGKAGTTEDRTRVVIYE